MPDSATKPTLEVLRAYMNQVLSPPGDGLSPYELKILQGPGQAPHLARGRVHEIMPDRPGHGAALGFLLRCLATAQSVKPRPVLWVTTWRDRVETGRLFAPGLAATGLDPERLILVSASREKDALWVLEEALGSGAFAGVGGFVRDLDLTPSRRLALAARRTDTPLLLLRPHATTGATAAETRWQVTPLPSTRDRFNPNAPGVACWQLELVRNRSGAPATWHVACSGDAHDPQDALDLVARDGHRTVAAYPQGRTPPQAGYG